MDVQIILGDKKKREAFLERLTFDSLSDSVRFLMEDEKSDSELLADCIYEDFVKCR